MNKRILNIKFLALMVLFVIGLNACESNDFDDSDSIKVKEKETTFTATIPGAVSINTRALTAKEECEVSDITLFLFKEDTTKPTITLTPKNIVQNDNGKTLTFKASIPEGNYHKAFIMANIAKSNGTGTEKWMNINDKWITDKTDPEYKKMPMYTYLSRPIIDGLPIYCNFARILAKVDVTKHASVNNFTLSSVTVCNYANRANFISVPTPDQIVTEPNNGLTYTSDAGANIINDIYLAETFHVMLNINNPDHNWQENPCLIVAGKYDGDTKDTYYRLNFTKKNKTTGDNVYTDIMRNHHYTFSIDRVSNRGYGSIQDAYESKQDDEAMKATILAWNDSDFEDVQINGPYMLAVSQKEVNLTYQVQTDTDTNNKLTITTNNANGWSAKVYADKACTVEAGADFWLTLSVTSGNGNYPDGNEVSLNCGINTASTNNNAYIKITAEQLTNTISVTQANPFEHSLMILDENDNEINALEFIAHEATAPEPQSFKVVWRPLNAVVSPSVSSDEVAFPTDFLNAGVENGTLIQVNPGVVPPGSLGNPIFQRSSTVTFSLPTYNGVISKTLKLIQHNKAITTSLNGVYVLDGREKSFDVTANVPWKIELKDVVAEGYSKDDIIESFAVQTGGSNMNITKGTVKFKLKNYFDPFDPDVIPSAVITLQTYIQEDGVWLPYRELTCKAMTGEIKGESNCYLVTNGNELPLIIPVSQMMRAMGTSTTTPPPTGTLGANWITNHKKLAAQVLWSDVDLNSPTPVVSSVGYQAGFNLDDSNVVVAPGTGVGNAVVILYERNSINNFYSPTDGDVIRWSWHIWNVNYNPYDLNHIWLDRNLGADENAYDAGNDGIGVLGLFYQWGRKDPMQHGKAITVNTLAPTFFAEHSGISNFTWMNIANPLLPTQETVDNLANAVKYPTVIYEEEAITALSCSAWFHTATYKGNDVNYLSNSVKTVYDPCPEGYKVPKKTVWGNTPRFQTATHGRNSSSHGGYYPQQGVLNRNLQDSGAVGTYMTSDKGKIKFGALAITGAYIKPNALTPFCFGVSVRCIREDQ